MQCKAPAKRFLPLQARQCPAGLLTGQHSRNRQDGVDVRSAARQPSLYDTITHLPMESVAVLYMLQAPDGKLATSAASVAAPSQTFTAAE